MTALGAIEFSAAKVRRSGSSPAMIEHPE